jgi:hypothetical protein
MWNSHRNAGRHAAIAAVDVTEIKENYSPSAFAGAGATMIQFAPS